MEYSLAGQKLGNFQDFSEALAPINDPQATRLLADSQNNALIGAIGSLVGSLGVGWGPTNDKCQAKELMAKAQTVAMPDTLYADAGYDAEWVHVQCREEWGPESVIKPAVHRADGKRNGIWRSAHGNAI